MRLALAIAVVLHALLLGALVRGDRLVIAIRVPARPAPTPIAPPIAVEFFDTPEAPGASGTSKDTGGGARATRVAIAASTGIGHEEAVRGEPTSPYMKMRGPDLGLSTESAARIAAAIPRELPDGVAKSGKLENAGGGKTIVHDRVTTMSVEQDGTAHFADKKDIDVKLKLPIPRIDVEGMRQDLGSLLTEWYADPYASTRYGPTKELSNINLAVPGACDAWGSVACDDPLAPGRERYAREQKQTGGSLVGGPADITAWLHRKYVGDPYASRKLKLLDDTRDERAARGAAFRDSQLVRSAELIDRNIARAAALTGHERRIALFELWDECSEGEGREAEAGQRARAEVIGWIRAHLPRGSADAFTDEEIAECRARQTSHQPFEPY